MGKKIAPMQDNDNHVTTYHHKGLMHYLKAPFKALSKLLHHSKSYEVRQPDGADSNLHPWDHWLTTKAKQAQIEDFSEEDYGNETTHIGERKLSISYEMVEDSSVSETSFFTVPASFARSIDAPSPEELGLAIALELICLTDELTESEVDEMRSITPLTQSERSSLDISICSESPNISPIPFASPFQISIAELVAANDRSHSEAKKKCEDEYKAAVTRFIEQHPGWNEDAWRKNNPYSYHLSGDADVNEFEDI